MRNMYKYGVTLVEILVTIVMLSFGIIACIQAINQSAVSLNNAQRVGMATTLLESEIEEIRSLGVPGYMSNMEVEVTAGRAQKVLSGTVATYTMTLKNIVPRLPADILTLFPTSYISITPNGVPFPGYATTTNEYKMSQKMYKVTVFLSWKGMKNKTMTTQMSTMIVGAVQ